MDNSVKRKLRLAAFFFVMFGAVVVDFASALMSLAFDAMFIGMAVAVIWPMLFNSEQQEPR